MTELASIDLSKVSHIGAEKKKPIRRRLTVRTPAGARSETWVAVEHKTDPRRALLESIGEIPEGVVSGCRVLVAVYQPPFVDRTSGGLYLAQKIQEEDRLENIFQGKAGLCVALGPDAYVDTAEVKFAQKIQVGDWVWFRPSDGMPCDVNEQFCRMFDSERYIIGKLPHPDMVA
jgi:PAS domain-containing protein